MITHEGITYQLKFFKKIAEKKFFLINSFNKFVRKISCNIRISSCEFTVFIKWSDLTCGKVYYAEAGECKTWYIQIYDYLWIL